MKVNEHRPGLCDSHLYMNKSGLCLVLTFPTAGDRT